MTIRTASADDAPVLAELAALTFPLACPPAVTAEDAEDFIARNLSLAHFHRYLADDSRRVLLAEDDDGAAGYAMLLTSPPADADVRAAITARPTAELSKFYLRPHVHGSGLATALMSAVTDAAAAAGAAGIWLGVNDVNLRAQRFYRRSGFRQIGRKNFTVGTNRFSDFVLELTLP